ncbi:MAG: hypothetical protein ACK5JU_04305 [Bacteroidales bacterium]
MRYRQLCVHTFLSTTPNYKSAIIDCNNIRTYHIKVINEQKMLSKESLNDFIGFYNVADFIEKVSFEIFKEHKKSINMMIMRYFQSNYLEGASKYLILYGILELGLKGLKVVREEFNNSKRIKQVYENELLTAILEKKIINESEENEFKKRWIAVGNDLIWKPAPRMMLILFEKFNLDYGKIDKYINEECDKDTMEKKKEGASDEECDKDTTGKEKEGASDKQINEVSNSKDNKKINDMFTLRNSITHGGSTHVRESINDILSLIVRVLILNKMGVNDVRICNSILYHDIIKS